MSQRFIAFTIILLASTGFAASANAGTAYAFTVENNAPVAMTIYADGKSKCDIDPGSSCRVTVTNFFAKFAYTMQGGAQTDFNPGNLEGVDLCKADAAGIHCIDPNAG